MSGRRSAIASKHRDGRRSAPPFSWRPRPADPLRAHDRRDATELCSASTLDNMLCTVFSLSDVRGDLVVIQAARKVFEQLALAQ